MPTRWRTGSESTWRIWKARPARCVTRSARRFWLRVVLVALLVSVTGPAMRTSSAQPSSSEPVVELSVSEADSILKTIDDLEVRVWELTALAEQDSIYHEERLRLRTEAYETMLEAYREERPGWVERIVKQPIIWLTIGMWLGVQAQ